MSYAVREAVWLQRMEHETGTKSTTAVPMLVRSDNHGAIEVAKNEVISEN